MKNTFFDPELVAFFAERSRLAAGLPAQPLPLQKVTPQPISNAAMLTAKAACKKYVPAEEPAIPLHRGPRGGRYYIRTKDDGTLRRDYV